MNFTRLKAFAAALLLMLASVPAFAAFLGAGAVVRLNMSAGQTLLSTGKDAPTVAYVAGGAITGAAAPNYGALTTAFGPLATAGDVILTAGASAIEYKILGSDWRPSRDATIKVTQALIDTPTALMLADVTAVYQLNVSPFTRYVSDGTALTELGTGAGDVAVADITDIGAIGSPLALATTVDEALDALAITTALKTFITSDNALEARAALGVTYGTNVMEANAYLQDLADSTPILNDALVFNGTAWVATALPGGGDALQSSGLDQFAATTSAALAGVLSDETGSGGGFVRATSPTISAPTVSGLVTFSGTDNWTANAMGALEIDTTKRLNTKTIAGPTTFTYSATPSSGTWFGLFLTNSDANPHLITLPSSPSSYSMSANATKNSFVVPPSSTTYIQWRYNGTLHRMFGEPGARDNFTATTAPAVTNDVDEGYAVGSKWTDTAAKVAYENLGAGDGAAVWRRSSSDNEDRIVIAISDETTAHTTGVAKVTFRMPYAFVLTGLRGSLTTASSSGIPTWDLNEAGVSVLGTKLTIDATEKTSLGAAAAVTISDSALADDAEMTIDIDVSGTGAAGGKVTLIGYRP